MVDWDGGHAGLAAAASGATRRGSWAPGAPDRGSRQRIDGSQLAHSATQDGAEAKTVAEGGEKALDWRPGWHQRPNHRPEARFGGACSRPDRGWLLTSPAGGHACILPPRRGHPFTSGLIMRYYWKDIETLIGNYWNWQVYSRTNRCTGK